jgi:hypothetical protein
MIFVKNLILAHSIFKHIVVIIVVVVVIVLHFILQIFLLAN